MVLKDKLNKIIGGGIVKKFIILTVAIIVLLDILTAAFMLSDLDKTLSEGLNRRGNVLVKHLAEESSGSLPYEDSGNFSRLANNIMIADSEVKCIYMTDAQNNLIGNIYSKDFLLDCNTNSSATVGNIIDFKAPVYGSREGFVHIGIDRTSMKEEIKNQTNFVIANILAESVLGILMAYFAGIYLTRPMRALLKGAQEIGKGNLGYKIESGTTNDEFQTLSNAFNQMSNNLSKNMGELLKLSTAVEEAPDGIQITDTDGYIIYSNKAIKKIFGFSPDEFKGKHVNEMNVDPEFASAVIIPSIKEKGHWVGELRVKRKDRKEFPILLTTSMVKDIKGEPIAFVGIIRDITELKEKEQLEKQLLQSDKLATIGQLAAGVAHEINNPIGNISVYTQMLLNKSKDENTKGKLRVIADEANRAALIVKGLLDFARQSEFKMESIDINKEIDNVLIILNPQLKDIEVKTSFKPLPYIFADRGQIQQVLMNLLKNSIQSITENGEIIVKTLAKHDHVEISISDNGCGITRKDLDKIFDPFFTTKEPGEGTGLGLSISYGIIKNHKGSIEVESEVGNGTTFTIKLPA
ncbi:Methanogenesis regulatory histidine kinase FilI [uncultured archaeon]|nr:Methanogenesis regulatory histidine kinase FilI [uncultured archaeon]